MSSSSIRLFDAVLDRVDRLVPERHKQDLAQHQRARLLLTLLALISITALFNAMNMIFNEAPVQAAGGLGLALVCVGLGVAYVRGASHRVVAIKLVLLASSYLLFLFWNTGGVLGTATVGYLICVPVTALALLGPRHALAAGVGVAVALVVMLAIQLHPELPQPKPLPGNNYLRAFVAEVVLLLYLLGMAWFQYNLAEVQRRALEIARADADQANQAKSSFLANMSHELRTPMNGVLGLTQVLLAEGELNPKQAHTLQTIRSSGQSLVQLLNDILDFSKVEAGALELELLPMDPQPFVHQVTELLSQIAHAKGLALQAEVADIGWVLADPTRLRQVLLNLVGNAIKFTPNGQVCIHLSHRDGRLYCRVQDTGIGISQSAQRQLFEPFTQADISTTRRFGGTGLGLAISRRLVELMGGQITLASTVGQGSTFSFDFPAASCLPQTEQPHPTQAAPINSTLRVLVAEDNLVNQMVARRMLLQLGIEAVIVSDGEQALQEMLSQHWDVVLMDAHMPVMDGLEATRQARAAGSTLYIVAMTAGTLRQERQAAEQAGMDDFLPKPVDLEALRALLAQRSPQRHSA